MPGLFPCGSFQTDKRRPKKVRKRRETLPLHGVSADYSQIQTSRLRHGECQRNALVHPRRVGYFRAHHDRPIITRRRPELRHPLVCRSRRHGAPVSDGFRHRVRKVRDPTMPPQGYSLWSSFRYCVRHPGAVSPSRAFHDSHVSRTGVSFRGVIRPAKVEKLPLPEVPRTRFP